MGIVTMGPPADLISFLQNAVDAKVFVEGGTFRGTTARWAASLFDKVFTIELSTVLHEAARLRHSNISNIEFIQGHTRDVLNQLVPGFREPVVFWLDAHWSGGSTSGEEDECPILDEIEIVNRSALDHIILIDDARLFMAPPPAPHKYQQWPDIWQIEQALQHGSTPRKVLIGNDIIIAVPERIGAEVEDFWHFRKPASRPFPVRLREALRALRA